MPTGEIIINDVECRLRLAAGLAILKRQKHRPPFFPEWDISGFPPFRLSPSSQRQRAAGEEAGQDCCCLFGGGANVQENSLSKSPGYIPSPMYRKAIVLGGQPLPADVLPRWLIGRRTLDLANAKTPDCCSAWQTVEPIL